MVPLASQCEPGTESNNEPLCLELEAMPVIDETMITAYLPKMTKAVDSKLLYFTAERKSQSGI